MKRRELIAGTAALLVSARRSWAQGTPLRIGFLSAFLGSGDAWRSGLREWGWIESKNLFVEGRTRP
jgi:putative ABC transport system substrate-binding protein